MTTPRSTPDSAGDLLDILAAANELADANWMDASLCTQTDPEAFFPEKGGSNRDAKRACRNCEVRAECLDWALEHDERHGIWGGLSERERRRLKKTMALAVAETASHTQTDQEGTAA